MLITGAGSGIGRRAASLFAAEGAQLALLDLDGAAAAEAAAETGGTAFTADVADEASVNTAVAAAAAALGGIDGVVNAAGITLTGSLAATELRVWRQVMSVNLDGTFLVCRACLPWLQQAPFATIVNIASGQALLPGPSLAAYAASERRRADADPGIGGGAGAADPGERGLPGHRGHADDCRRGARCGAGPSRYALRRMGTALEIAQTLLFLTGRKSAFVTGAALAVDGGRSITKGISRDRGSASRNRLERNNGRIEAMATTRRRVLGGIGAGTAVFAGSGGRGRKTSCASARCMR